MEHGTECMMEYEQQPPIVSEILGSQQGPYEWCTRDCLTTAHALVEGLLGAGRGPDYSAWHCMSEPRAIAKVRRLYGGVGGAHFRGFASFDDVDVLSGDTPLKPGDIVQLSGLVEVAGSLWDTAAKGDLIGFVGDSHEIFHWAAHGLVPAGGAFEIAGVFRCRV